MAVSDFNRGRAWLIKAGVPITFYVIGFSLAVTGGAYFWPGILVGFAAAAVLWLDWWFFSRAFTSNERRLGFVGVLGLCVVLIWLVGRTAPVEISANPLDIDYVPNTEIAGIKWNPSYYDLRVFISNNSSDQYSDIETLLRTDLYIAGIGFLRASSQCTAAPEAPFRDASIGFKDKNGHMQSIPLFSGQGQYSSIFKINCDKLAGGDHLEIVVPIASLNQPKPGQIIPGGLLNPRTKPSWLTMKLRYDGRGRNRETDFSQCFVGACETITMPQKF
jgi:hypothetical protein